MTYNDIIIAQIKDFIDTTGITNKYFEACFRDDKDVRCINGV